MDSKTSEKLKTTSVKDEIEKPEKKETLIERQRPTAAFIAASWVTLFTGMISYCVGLWNAEMYLNEKGYYFTILLFALFAVISVQKSVRDKIEGLPVTDIYYGISWFVTVISILLLVIGLWNADLELSEKGFYGMSFTLSIYAAIAVQKNTRDVQFIDKNI
ncbi:hypothetical protein GTQ40_11405 [Flavobacteriaceae bacterium R38]|nr:hypothetical protein [Flavobacteriaceae bacterium R38]